jgi:hypothetical protein
MDRQNRTARSGGRIATLVASRPAAYQRDVASWEARTEYDLGVLIGRYLAENEPPAPSAIADAVAAWSARLLLSGESRLAADGVSPLRVVPR